jgi:hypothetical protein
VNSVPERHHVSPDKLPNHYMQNGILMTHLDMYKRFNSFKINARTTTVPFQAPARRQQDDGAIQRQKTQRRQIVNTPSFESISVSQKTNICLERARGNCQNFTVMLSIIRLCQNYVPDGRVPSSLASHRVLALPVLLAADLFQSSSGTVSMSICKTNIDGSNFYFK